MVKLLFGITKMMVDFLSVRFLNQGVYRFGKFEEVGKFANRAFLEKIKNKMDSRKSFSLLFFFFAC